ncbi:hypothetical protein JHK87_021052 [Glycine soja]|nr:hypothetical protein JHK87_021052 [Glycine soja]
MPPRSPSINKLCVERLSKTKGKPTLLSFLIVQNAESGLGGDPYHWPGQAMGLSFSVPEGVKVPSSLVNIFKELHQDLGCSIPTHGNLQKWALQSGSIMRILMPKKAGNNLLMVLSKTISQKMEELCFCCGETMLGRNLGTVIV